MAINISTPAAKDIDIKFNTLAITDTSAKDMFVIPKGSTPLYAIIINDATVGGTSPALNVGTSADPDGYVDATNGLTLVQGCNVIPLDGVLGVTTETTSDLMITADWDGTSLTGGGSLLGIAYVRNIVGSK